MDFTQAGLQTRDLAALGVTRGRQLSDEWVRTTRGVYLPAYVAADPHLAAVASAVAILGPRHVLGGWAALAFQGVPFFDLRGHGPRVPVHCLPGSELRRRSGLQPWQGRIEPDEWSVLEGTACATIARAAFDEMRLARSVDEAVVVADMALSRITEGGRTSVDAIGRVIAAHPKMRGVVRARAALALASDRSASPWESRLRMRAVRDVGITGLLVNVPIFGLDESLLGIADLFEPQTGTVLESDGAGHREIDQHGRDNVREERFEDAGLSVGRFTSADHAHRWNLVGRIDQVRARGRRSLTRTWTLEAPAWWQTWAPGARYR